MARSRALDEEDGAGPIQKQLLAIVDGRTTICCLHAAGQIRNVDEPYDTLYGAYMSPPFHYRCRSISAVFMPGFTSRLREDANEEVMKRPADERRLGSSGYQGKIPKRPPVQDTPPVQQPGSFPKRNAAAPDAPLRDVPEQSRGEFIARHPERFETVTNRPGSQQLWVTDRQDSARYLLARPDGAGAAAQRVAGRYAAAVGFPALVLLASALDDGGHGWVLVGHPDDQLPYGRRVVGPLGGQDGLEALAPDLERGGLAVAALLLAWVVDGARWRGTNVLRTATDARASTLLLPWWLGDSLGAGRDGWDATDRAGVPSLREYLRGPGAPYGLADLIAALDDREVEASYDAAVSALRSVDASAATVGLGPLGAAWRQLLLARVAALRSSRESFLAYLTR